MAEQPSRWRPIETAPTDQVEVIVWDGERVRTALCVTGDWHASNGEEMVDTGQEYIELVILRPTHWMSLPKPPECADAK